MVRDGESVPIAENDEGFMKQLRMGKSFLHGVDKDGRPICFVRVRLHKQADQTEKSLEKYTIYIMETARLMLRTPVDTACVVFDMTSFSLANMVCRNLRATRGETGALTKWIGLRPSQVHD